jgi:hypothetical protein
MFCFVSDGEQHLCQQAATQLTKMVNSSALVVDQNTMHPSETKQNNTSLTEQMLFYI